MVISSQLGLHDLRVFALWEESHDGPKIAQPCHLGS